MAWDERLYVELQNKEEALHLKCPFGFSVKITRVYILAGLPASFMMKRNNNKPTNKTNKQSSSNTIRTNKGNGRKGESL